MNGRALALVAVGAFGASTAPSQTPVPITGEFQVNSYTTSFQVLPVVAPGTGGEFLVIWQSPGSFGTDTFSSSIQGQRYDAGGRPIGGEFQINSYTTRNQDAPAVAAVPGGGFVVVWDSYGSDGTDPNDLSIQGQRLDASGSSIGSQFQVNTYTTYDQDDPEVAVDGAGNFVVVWDSFGSAGTDSDSLSVQGQRFNAAGAKIGSEFQVNNVTPSLQHTAKVVMHQDGSFVVVWESLANGVGVDPPSLKGQRYDPMGMTVGGEFLVNSYTTGSQGHPGLARGAGGGFIAVWGSGGGSYGSDNSFSSIQGQRFDAMGMLDGGQFQVNSYTSLNQSKPTVAANPQGDFIVAWEDFNSPTDGSYSAVEAQRFDADGELVGEQFEVNVFTTHLQQDVAVAVQPSGDFMIVWESRGGSFGTDTSYSSIQGRLYASPIFVDGFESGDTSSWSTSTP